MSFVVKNPETGQFFRFQEIEHFIIQFLDGSTSAAAIRARVEQEFGGSLDDATLREFVSSLQRRGLLVGETASSASQAQKQGRVRGTLLYLRVKAFDPDRLLDGLINRLRFLFTPYFLGLSAILVLFSLLILGTNYAEIQRDLADHLGMGTLLVAWLVILLTVIAHEFAHGLTCKHFGGRVHEIGFLLLYFMPALYCNVSDAWRFPQKSRRLWVTFSGAYLELFLWALAILTWRVTAPETVLNHVALIMIGTSGIRILFNLNPLIKLDGYYLLGDYLEIPNLRSRAFRYLGTALKRRSNSVAHNGETVGRRERRIYWVYGLLAGMFSVLLLGYLGSILADFLVGRLQGPGFIILTVLVMVIFKNPLTRLVRAGFSFFTGQRGRRVFAPKRLVFLGSTLVILFFVELDLTVSGEFRVFPTHNADIRARVDSIIEEIYVHEGDWVQEGDPIARLSDREFRSALGKVQAEILEQKANLRLLLAGPTKEKIALARGEVEQTKVRLEHTLARTEEAQQIHAKRLAMVKSAVEKAQEQLKFGIKKRDRLQALSQKKVVPEIRLEQADEDVAVRQNEVNGARAEWKMVRADVNAEAREDLAAAKSQVEQAEAKLNVLLAGSRSEEVEATRAVIAGLESRQTYLQGQLDRARVVSPISGVVTTPKPEEKVGQRVEKGDLILEVYEFQTVKVETLVSEKDIGDVREGQNVVLKARAYPDKSFSGTVTAIAPTAMDDDSGLGRNVLRVITEIDNTALMLKPQMTGYTKIFCGERPIIGLLTRRLRRFLKVEFWSWW